jgi:hypothetical protein
MPRASSVRADVVTSWDLLRNQRTGATHVIPAADAIEHQTYPACWCRPVWDDDAEMWVHHSADGREEREEPRPKYPSATRH